MEQHPIPQHIGSFEFKLFGPLTIRQFITLAIPMSVAILVYFSPVPFYPRIILAAIIGTIAVIAALVPVQGRPLDKWLLAFIRAVTSPTQRIWIRETIVPSYLSIVTSAVPQKKGEETVTRLDKERLRAYLHSLPASYASPLDEKESLALERLGLKYESAEGGKLPPAIMWSEKKEGFEPDQAVFAQSSLPQLNADTTGVSAQKTKAAPKISQFAKPYTLQGLEKKLKNQTESGFETSSQVKTRLATDSNFKVENIIPLRTAGKQVKLIHGIGKTRIRKLHYAPPVGFDLSKLPIRGERKFEISEELKKRFDLETTPKSPIEAGIEMEQKQTPFVKPHEIVLPKAQKQKNTSPAQKATEKDQLIPLTKTPNVVSGIVVDKTETPLENIIIVIKDSNGIPVRALKTNRLGQFVSATPLENGKYTVELESDLFVFKLHTISINGAVLDSIKIMAEGNKN